MTGFEKIDEEIKAFKKTTLYHQKYDSLINMLRVRPHDSRLVMSTELEKVFKLSGPQVRDIVKAARRLGIPIGSCGRGYFYARNAEELFNTLHHLQERRNSLSYTVRALEKCYPNQNQGTLKL